MKKRKSVGLIRAALRSLTDLTAVGHYGLYGLFGRTAARLLCVVCACVVFTGAVAAQTTVPKAIMQSLAKQLRIDSPAMRDCEVKTEFNFYARAVDLNGDKQPEYMLTSVGGCECGQVNCSQWVYRANDKSFELLLEGEGYTLATAATSHGGYRDLSTTSRGSAVIVDHVSYTYDGRAYKRASSTIENLETHEIKPTAQRIQFARGASSATVNGTASAGFPDSWTFVAKRGQTLSLALARTAGVATVFTIVGLGTDGGRVIADSQTKWNDKLPSDGLYTILVDTRGEGRASYALTVGIR
ncbi:MAG: hypothetical protein ABI852_02230 [Gemmatimonadaceae bacterium]